MHGIVWTFGWLVVSLSLSKASSVQEAASNSCLLQRSSLQSAGISVEDDSGHSRLGKLAPGRKPKSTPIPGAKDSDKSPSSQPKSGPLPGGKTEADQESDDQEEDEEEKPLSEEHMVASTPIEEIVHDKIMSQRAEIHITEGLAEIEKEYGSVNKFAKAMRRSLLEDLNIDPRRLVILNVQGKYLSENNTDSGEEKPGHVSRIDFEVYPGPPGVSTPADVIEKLALKFREQTGKLFQGDETKQSMNNAALVINSGLKAESPEADYEHTHSIVEEPAKHEHNESSHGEHGGEHGYPWQWFGWNGGIRSTSLAAMPLLIVVCVSADMGTSI
jgi:hypothetical protein